VDGDKARRILNLTDGSEKPPGQWNQMVIECRGREIAIWVNGDEVNRGTNCTADHGQIALQAEGAVCEFRRIELTPLDRLPSLAGRAGAPPGGPVGRYERRRTRTTDEGAGRFLETAGAVHGEHGRPRAVLEALPTALVALLTMNPSPASKSRLALGWAPLS